MPIDLNDQLIAVKGAGDLDRLGFYEGDVTHPTFLFGHSIELYCENGSTRETRKRLLDLVASYVAAMGDKITHYHPNDSRRLKRIDGKDWEEYYKQYTNGTTAGGLRHFAATVYGFENGEDDDIPTPHYCEVIGVAEDKRYSVAHAYMPAGWPERDADYVNYIDLMKRWCTLIKVAHGTAGFSIIFEEGQPKSRDGRLAFPFIKRFPGLDYPDPIQWNSRGVDNFPTRVIRSINWLSAIDDGFVTELGGFATVTAALGPDCRIHHYDGGIIIQAGDRPQLGDVNRGLVLDPYRAVARVLKPLRFEAFNPKRPYIQVDRPLDSREETRKWLARFD